MFQHLLNKKKSHAYNTNSMVSSPLFPVRRSSKPQVRRGGLLSNRSILDEVVVEARNNPNSDLFFRTIPKQYSFTIRRLKTNEFAFGSRTMVSNKLDGIGLQIIARQYAASLPAEKNTRIKHVSPILNLRQEVDIGKQNEFYMKTGL